MKKIVENILVIIFTVVFVYLLFEIKLYQNVISHDDAIERMHTWENIFDTLITLAIVIAIYIPVHTLWEKSKESENDKES